MAKKLFISFSSSMAIGRAQHIFNWHHNKNINSREFNWSIVAHDRIWTHQKLPILVEMPLTLFILKLRTIAGNFWRTTLCFAAPVWSFSQSHVELFQKKINYPFFALITQLKNQQDLLSPSKCVSDKEITFFSMHIL